MSLTLAVQLKDSTEFLVTDTTGWSGELVRTDFSLFLLAEVYQKTAYQTAQSASVLLPALAEEWTVTTTQDGVYRMVLVAAPAYNPLVVYAKNSVVAESDKLYISLQNVPEGTAISDIDYWKEVKQGKDLDLLRGTENGHLAILHHLHDARTQKCVAEKAIAYAGEKCGCEDELTMIKDWAWSTLFQQASAYAMLFGEYEEAGLFIDNLNARCNNDSGKTPCNCH